MTLALERGRDSFSRKQTFNLMVTDDLFWVENCRSE